MKGIRRHANSYNFRKALIMPVIAAALVAAGCDGSTTEADTKASVRFFNATTGMAGNVAFTVNGQFASGSALSFAQSSCSTLDAGSTALGFGAANSGGTGLSGGALAILNNQNVTANGNYTVVATGSAGNPALFLLDNRFTGSLGVDQAAVRFVNLAPGVGAAANTFTVLSGTIGSTPTTVVGTDIAVGSPTPFSGAASGSSAFTILVGHDIAITGNAATLTLQAGTVNTIAIVENTSGGFQLINMPRCA